MRWLELSVEAHPEAVDAIANVFQEQGTGGVSIEQPVRSHIEGEEPPTFLGLPVIRAYLPMDGTETDRERRIEESLWHLQAFNLSPVSELRRREVAEEDWANAWKEHFHPLKIDNVVIKPSWREWDADPTELVIVLDPGMAFGTGLHPTTRLMLSAIQGYVRSDMHVLDLGSGSGILAIAAAKMGARVEALDISSVAVEVARENIEANHMSERITVDEGSIDATGGRQYDLILANIIASVLMDLAGSIHGALLPGATVLASGIIDERLDGVCKAFADAGLEIDDRRQDEDWWLVVARRPA